MGNRQVRCSIRLITHHRIVGQHERELPVLKVQGRLGAMIEPLEKIPPREQTLVEAAQCLGVGGIDLGRVGRAALSQ